MAKFKISKELKEKSPYISVMDAFDLIRSKTDLQTDAEIAEFLINIDINEYARAFFQFKLDNGSPLRDYRDYTKPSKMDLVLRAIATESVNPPETGRTLVWDRHDFIWEFEDATGCDLEDYSELDSEIPTRGKSPAKLTAQQAAMDYARDQWNRDAEENRQTRIGEMAELVWAYLADVNLADQRPETVEALRDWIRRVAPPYASRGGRPKKNTP